MKEDFFIKTDPQAFWMYVFDYAFKNMMKKSFFSVRIKNSENFELRDPNKSNIIYANHCCWWDGIIGYLLCRKVFKTQLHMMIEELYRFPLLSKIGAFSIKKDTAHHILRSLDYCTEFLQNSENSLWIFPQGVVLPPDYRPIKFGNGISYICNKLNGVNLIPVAHKYTFLREDRPEILIEIGKPIILEEKISDKKSFTEYIENSFTSFIDQQRDDISKGKLENYEIFLKSRLCVVKLIEKYFKPAIQRLNT